MAQLSLEPKDVERFKAKFGFKHLTRVSHFHTSVNTEKMGTVIDGTFAVIEYRNAPCAIYYTVKEPDKILS